MPRPARAEEKFQTTMSESRQHPAQPQVQLGHVLRAIRQGHRYSISDVAAHTGISSSFLSLVETGKSDISFGRLMRLTEFYRVTLGDLMASQADSEVTVTRHEDPVTVPAGAEGITMTLLASGSESRLTTFVADWECDAATAEPTRHHGEAFVYVVSGTVRVHLETGADPVVLHAGDSAHLAAGTRRTYRNVGGGNATLVGVLLEPRT